MSPQTLRRSALATPATVAAGSACALSIAEAYATHFHYLWRCLRGLGVASDAVDDAVHDVFLVVQRKLPEFDGQVLLTTWLYAIALRVARRYRTRAAHDAAKLVTYSGDDASEPALGPSAIADPAELQDGIELEERLDLAHRALQGLDDDKREAFVLAFVEQLPASEIAQITGVPLNTAYSRIRAARRVFAARLARLQAVQRKA